MDFQKAVNQRKMVRSFSTKQVEKNKLDTIVENMLSGPSAGYSQGTEILVLNSEKSRDLFFQQWGEKEEREKYTSNWPNLENAPVIIIVIANEHKYRDRYNEGDKVPLNDNAMPWWFIDAGMSTMLGLLTVVDQDLVATFTGIQSQDYMQNNFKVPEDRICIGAILLGYQKGEYRPSKSIKRGKRPRDEVIHYNTM